MTHMSSLSKLTKRPDLLAKCTRCRMSYMLTMRLVQNGTGQSCQLTGIIDVVLWLFAEFRVLSGHKNLDCIHRFNVKSVAQGNDLILLLCDDFVCGRK